MVDYISALSRLQVDEGEKEAVTAELERIVSYMDRLNELENHDIDKGSQFKDFHGITSIYGLWEQKGFFIAAGRVLCFDRRKTDCCRRYFHGETQYG